MMFKRVVIFCVLFCSWLTVSHAANSIEKIRIVEHADKTRIVLEVKKKPLINVYSRSKSTQIVVDFASTKNKVPAWKLAKQSSNILRIEHAKSKNKADTRLVFHLAQAIKYKNFELVGSKRKNYRLVIDLPVKPFSKRVASKSKVVAKAKYIVKPKTISKAKTSAQAKKTIKKITLKKTPKLRDVVIAIDAGHGGKDPGSIGFKRFVEKDINLAIAKRTVAILNNKKGIKAVLIRKTDKFISLNKRSAIARKYKAELLVSIHSDGFTSSRPSGASTLVLSNGRAKYEMNKKLRDNNLDDLLGGVGDAIKSSENSDDLQRTFIDLGQDYSLTAGYQVASNVHSELSRVTRMHKSKPVEQSLAVLKSIDIPSLLVEAGFVTNYKEGKKLTTRAHQQKIANAVAQGIYKYFRTMPPKDTYLAYALRNPQKARRLASSHTVAKGDSLSKIANAYGVTIARLKQYNNLKKDNINIGQKLKIPTS